MTSISYSKFSIASEGKINTYANRIEALLESRGCTKAWLARQLGISRQGLNQILKSNNHKFVSEIAEIFNVNPQWLYSGEGKIVYSNDDASIRYIKVFSYKDLKHNDFMSTILPIEEVATDDVYNEYFGILYQNADMIQKFPNNSILIFQKNTSPENGSYIVFKNPKMGSYEIGQYFKTQEGVMIIFLNDFTQKVYDAISNVLGVLKETRIRF